jgi:ADP-ribose pyrophosphatase
MSKVVESRTICSTPIFKVERDVIQDDYGLEMVRAVVRKRSCVGILALDEEGRILLVRQYRHPFGREVLEIPAGVIEEGEDPAAAARRELEEECGYHAKELQLLSRIAVSPGWTDEVIHLFLATDLIKTEQRLDDEERIEIVRVNYEDFEERIVADEIVDAKSVAAFFHALRYLVPEDSALVT